MLPHCLLHGVEEMRNVKRKGYDVTWLSHQPLGGLTQRINWACHCGIMCHFTCPLPHLQKRMRTGPISLGQTVLGRMKHLVEFPVHNSNSLVYIIYDHI